MRTGPSGKSQRASCCSGRIQGGRLVGGSKAVAFALSCGLFCVAFLGRKDGSASFVTELLNENRTHGIFHSRRASLS